jgi:lipoprotein-releasing system ATP-binding protein
MNDTSLHTPLLSLRGVPSSSAPDADLLNFSLSPGELAIIRVRGRGPLPPLAALALGIEPPPSGELLFQGRSWQNLSIARAENFRLQTGCVFDPEKSTAWLENLDVDENVMLAQLFHGAVSRRKLEERALSLAGEFGLDDLPRTRPSETPPSNLVRAQWIRAFLPKPLRLLILEDPTQGAPTADVPALVSRIQSARNDGAAVACITHDASLYNHEDLAPDHHFSIAATGEIKDANLKTVSDT